MKAKCNYGTVKGICFINGYPCKHARLHTVIDNCNKRICSPDLYGTIKTSCKTIKKSLKR